MIQHERIAHRREAGIAAGLVQLREQLRGVARQVCAVLLRVEIQLAEGELLLHAKLVGVRLQIRIQLGVGRLGLGGNVVGDEFHLLLQAAADDEVVLVQAQRQRLAVIDFLPHPLPDQTLPFLAGGRPLPGAGEGLHHGRELALR